MKTTLTIALLLLLQFATAQTNSWKGTTSTAWGTASNWSLNLVPTSAHDVVISNASFTGSFQPSLTSNSVCKTLIIGGTKAATLTMFDAKTLTVSGTVTINSNGSLIHGTNGNYGTLTVKGDFINNGVYTATNTKTRVIFNGITQQIGGTIATAFKRITINAGSNVTLTNNISTTGTTTPSVSVSGTLNLGSYLISGNNGMTVYSGGKNIYLYSNICWQLWNEWYH